MNELLKKQILAVLEKGFMGCEPAIEGFVSQQIMHLAFMAGGLRIFQDAAPLLMPSPQSPATPQQSSTTTTASAAASNVAPEAQPQA